jgi:hypothetical protein
VAWLLGPGPQLGKYLRQRNDELLRLDSKQSLLANALADQADRLRLFVLVAATLRVARLIDIGRAIRKSSSFFPDLSSAVSQRGCLPRPDQVSDGWAGFLYFGKTCG